MGGGVGGCLLGLVAAQGHPLDHAVLAGEVADDTLCWVTRLSQKPMSPACQW